MSKTLSDTNDPWHSQDTDLAFLNDLGSDFADLAVPLFCPDKPFLI